jgi:predicted DNA-binding transcriptional regulator YafY
MKDNKHFALRFRILDRCFSDSKREYEFNELRNIVNRHLNYHYGPNAEIEVRQLRNDFREIRNFLPEGVELKTYRNDKNGKFYYRYSKRNYSYYKNELSIAEVEKLRSTIEMLDKFRGLPNEGWLDDVVAKLEVRFGIIGNSENLVSFSQNEQLKGIENLSYLISATINHQVLDIIYTKFDGVENHYILHPYFIKQYNGRWFLFGLDEYENRIKNLPIDRITQISESSNSFIKNDKTDFNTYFNDIVGVSFDENQELINLVLKFSPNRFKYVTSKPIHSSQTIVSEEECTISLHIRPTRELEQQLFSFGPDIEIVSPESYREEFSRKIALCFKKYFGVH